MKNANLWARTQYTTIQSTSIPSTVDLEETVRNFSEHQYHLGGWPASYSAKSSLPPSEDATHIVRKVKLDDNGDLEIAFELIHTLRGQELEKQYVKNIPFELVPILDENNINILRFDFKKKE